MTDILTLTDQTWDRYINSRPALVLLSTGVNLRSDFSMAFKRAAAKQSRVLIAQLDPAKNPRIAAQMSVVGDTPVLIGWYDDAEILRRAKPWGEDISLAIEILERTMSENPITHQSEKPVETTDAAVGRKKNGKGRKVADPAVAETTDTAVGRKKNGKGRKVADPAVAETTDAVVGRKKNGKGRKVADPAVAETTDAVVGRKKNGKGRKVADPAVAEAAVVEAAVAETTEPAVVEIVDPAARPFIVSDASFQKEVVDYSNDLPVLVDFWAAWCGPCRMVAPIMERLAADFAGQVRIAKVDTDANPGLSQTFRIMSIPTIMAFKDGQMVFNQAGAFPEPAFRDLVQQLIDLNLADHVHEDHDHEAHDEVDHAHTEHDADHDHAEHAHVEQAHAEHEDHDAAEHDHAHKEVDQTTEI